jgi:hypothetical protein
MTSLIRVLDADNIFFTIHAYLTCASRVYLGRTGRSVLTLSQGVHLTAIKNALALEYVGTLFANYPHHDDMTSKKDKHMSKSTLLARTTMS